MSDISDEMKRDLTEGFNRSQLIFTAIVEDDSDVLILSKLCLDHSLMFLEEMKEFLKKRYENVTAECAIHECPHHYLCGMDLPDLPPDLEL